MERLCSKISQKLKIYDTWGSGMKIMKCLYALNAIYEFVSFLTCQKPLEVFVNAPADGCTWHIGQHTRFESSEKPLNAMSIVNNAGSLSKSAAIFDLCICWRAFGLQKCFDNIEWCSNRWSNCTSYSACHHVDLWVVRSLWIEFGSTVLIRRKLNGLKWNWHGHGCWERYVERFQSFIGVYLLCTLTNRFIGWIS